MEENAQTPKKNSNFVPVAVIITLVLIITAGVVGYNYMGKNNTTESQNTTSATQEASPAQEVVQETSSQFQDGEYTAVGNYTSPGGAEQVGVTVVLVDGVITESQVEVKATRPISKTKQEDFAANYQEQVVGRNIEEVELTKVSGSSLTPKGFNDALEQIRLQAQS